MHSLLTYKEWIKLETRHRLNVLKMSKEEIATSFGFNQVEFKKLCSKLRLNREFKRVQDRARELEKDKLRTEILYKLRTLKMTRTAIAKELGYSGSGFGYLCDRLGIARAHKFKVVRGDKFKVIDK